MESVKTEYFVEWLANDKWIRGRSGCSEISSAIKIAEHYIDRKFDHVKEVRIVEEKTVTTERHMTLECAKNERSK